MDFNIGFDDQFNHFSARKLLQSDVVCTRERYDNCFSLCPPMIPGPPPPPKSLKDYRRTWCTGHNKPWICIDTNSGPEINGTNPKLEPTVSVEKKPSNQITIITLSVLLPILLVIIILITILLVIRRNRKAFNKKADNTYNLEYLSKPQAPTWTDNDGTEVAVEDGSEIFYQVDRSALSVGMNGGVGGNARSIPDVVHSSNATLRKSPPTNMSVFDLGRSGSATSQAPLLSSPEIMAHNRRRNNNRTISGGQENEESDLGSPPYTRYGAAGSHQALGRKRSHEPTHSGTTFGASSGYMTYSPNTKSHPSLYNGGGEISDSATGTTIRTPKSRQRSFGSTDHNKPRVLRKPSAATNIQRSDSMTLNRAAGRENYRNNWENFDEVTATMRKNKNGPANREIVLGTDSFIESFTSPEQEEATSVDQLGLPTRNPFLTGYYDYEAADSEADFTEVPYNQASSADIDHRSPPAVEEDNSSLDYYRAYSPPARSDTHSPEYPPSYDDIIPPRLTPVNMSLAPTLDLRGGRRDRTSEYDSEASVVV